MTIVRYAIGKASAELVCYIHDDLSQVGGSYRLRPAVIVFPGGGYNHLSPREADPAALPVFAHGYNAFIMRYSVGDDARRSIPEAEAAEAIALIRERHDELLTDPAAIAVMGFSAGGHAAASIACHWEAYGRASRPDAAVLSYPVITMGPLGHKGSTDILTGGDEELVSYYSLENQVTPSVPPCFIWHTAADEAVPVENSLMMASALRDGGVPFELHIFSEGRHGLSAGHNETGPAEKGVQDWIALAISWLSRLFRFAF